MKTYNTYRNSNVLWVGNIPEHWQTKMLSQVATERKQKNKKCDRLPVLSLSYGNIVRRKSLYEGLLPKSFDNYQVIYSDDIILRLTDLQNDHTSLRTGLVRENGIITSAYLCISPRVNPQYLHYALHTYDVKKMFYSMGSGVRQSSNWNEVRYILLPVPPRSEQNQIVRFLDWKVSEINKLINVKYQEIDVLKEQRQRKLSHVVTHGLNPEVTTKETGIKWVGSIPDHWKCVPLKRCAQVKSGITLGKKYPSGTRLIDVPYLRVANVQNGHVVLDTVVTLKVTPEEAQQYQLPKGCVLMTEGGDRDKLGRGCVWNGEIENCIHQNHIFAVTVNDELIQNKWLEYVSASDVGRIYFDLTAIRTTNLACTNASKVMAFPIPLPPREEQEIISAELQKILVVFDRIHNVLECQIEQLYALKDKIIADAVTGKIDVRDIEIPEYEFVDEEPDTENSNEEEVEEQEET